jgi:polypeptide N-acetylgalactosaminyltransferase
VLVLRDPSTCLSLAPYRAGGLFAAHREYFWELGGYDRDFGFWGTENIELSFRLWQCGGRLECTICSRVYHIFRKGGHAYSMPGDHVTKNKLRTSMIWMDEYGDIVRKALGEPDIDYGSLDKMIELRKNLNCKPFDWFLKNVFPESPITDLTDVLAVKQLKHPDLGSCLDHLGHAWDYERKAGVEPCSPDPAVTAQNFLIVKVRNSDIQHEIRPMDNLETCLTHDGGFVNCDSHPTNTQWVVDMDSLLIRVHSRAELCLSSDDTSISIRICSESDQTQQWEFEKYVRPGEEVVEEVEGN